MSPQYQGIPTWWQFQWGQLPSCDYDPLGSGHWAQRTWLGHVQGAQAVVTHGLSNFWKIQWIGSDGKILTLQLQTASETVFGCVFGGWLHLAFGGYLEHWGYATSISHLNMVWSVYLCAHYVFFSQTWCLCWFTNSTVIPKSYVYKKHHIVLLGIFCITKKLYLVFHVSLHQSCCEITMNLF